MGQGQSSNPRRLTVVNDEASGVIKISDSVVERLKSEMGSKSNEQQQQQQPPPQQAPPQPQPQPPPQYYQPPPQPQPPPPPPPPPQQQQQQQQQQPPQQQIIYKEEPSMSALKVRAQKEAELKTVESYWQQRVKALRDHHLKSNVLEEESFKATVAEVDKMFLKSRDKPICQDCRHAVLQCYKANPDKSLLCAKEVQLFAKCVESARLGSLLDTSSKG